MRPSLLLIMASGIRTSPPPGQTAAHRQTLAASTSVGVRLSGWRAGLWYQMLRADGKGFLMTQGQERVSYRFFLFRFYADVFIPRSCPPRFWANAGAAGVIGRGRVARKGGCRSRARTASYLLFFFCHDAPLTPCRRPSLPTTSRQRRSSRSRRLLVSRPWYTRGTASLTVQLPQPAAGRGR